MFFCKLLREYHPTCTTGTFSIYHEALLDPIFTCRSLEKPWLNNQPELSCIPDGTYPIFFTFSQRLQFHCYELLNVPNRSGIRIHPFNLAEESEGCISLGTGFNKDSYFLNNSKRTIQKMEVVLKSQPSKLIIVSAAALAA